MSGFAAISLLAMPISGFAQDTTEASVAPDEQVASPETNWLKVCEAATEEGELACIMRQVVVANGQFLGSFVLRIDPTEESRLLAVVAVPLGVLLPIPMKVQIDGGQPISLPYLTCDQTSCVSQLAVNEAYVNSLKRGANLRVTVKNRQMQDLDITFTLAGFTAVYESEEALTFEEYNNLDSGVTALEQQLQDRAEQIRREQEAAAAAEAEGDGTADSEADAAAAE